MKAILLAGVMVLASAGVVAAAPIGTVSEINVHIGAPLQAKAQKYGDRELEYLSDDLETQVQRALTNAGEAGPGGARLDLTIVDATPNRPTFQQMAANIDLCYCSHGIGGADIKGSLTYPDGRTVPLSFRWYETDIRSEEATATWSDAQWTFERFAYDLARGRV
ncbi:MAG: hypothetical protein ACHP84_20700 [Caulobacterales bacterium]